MRVAQQLYEGLALGDEGEVGLITYMRTDSTRLADEAVQEARQYIHEHYGKDYIPTQPRRYRSQKAAQEAHEAIRPTSVLHTPDQVKRYLSAEQQCSLHAHLESSGGQPDEFGCPRPYDGGCHCQAV